MKSRFLVFLAFGLLAICQLSGCGYAFQGSGTILPPDVKLVYIPIVENNSTEPGLAVALTEALQERFSRFGVVKVTESRELADAILEVVIQDVRRTTNTVTANTEVSQQQDTQMTVSGTLRRTSGVMLWRNDRMAVSRGFGGTQSTVVTTSSDFAGSGLSGDDLSGLSAREVSRGQEQQALDQLIETVAARIYDESVAPDF